MKNISILLAALVLIGLSFSCTQLTTPLGKVSENQEIVYDSVKAAQYGADEYGMKKYIMAFLKRGNNTELSEDSAHSLQMEHLRNIMRMADEGKLVVAGPFLGNQSIRGIYIFNVSTITEAKELTLTDPAIKAGVLEMDLLEWYGSAALVDVNKNHKIFSKKDITSAR